MEPIATTTTTSFCGTTSATATSSTVLSTTRRSLASRAHKRDNQEEPKQEALRVQVVSSKTTKKRQVCFGCGADIVPKTKINTGPESNSASTATNTTAGSLAVASERSDYWAERKATLLKSKISNWALCHRCKALTKQKDPDKLMIDNDMLPTAAAVEAFRREVRKIRSLHAVVILVVDAINVSGSVIRTLREYVGGNPILLAITRCDLLPDYLWEKTSVRQAKREFARRAKELHVAEVFMISLPPGNKKHDTYHDREANEDSSSIVDNQGVSQLAAALLSRRQGRDVYVVGAANIGKSTLTDALVDELIQQSGLSSFVNQGHLGQKRLDAIREMRVTKSALPGTTLQSIRVPCFPDHVEALWDTPGLLLDVTKHHFPVRNIEKLQRTAPSQIVPVQLSSSQNRFVVQIGEEGDDERLPLLRVVVRHKREGRKEQGGGKRNTQNGKETRLVWNSVFALKAKVFDESPPPPPTRKTAREKSDDRETSVGSNTKQGEISPLDRKARKEARRRAWEARIKAEQKEIGMKEWRRREEARRLEQAEEQRTIKLSNLQKVASFKIQAGKGTDVAVKDFGWFGFLAPRDALLEVYAPSTGAKVSATPTLSLPLEWGWKGNSVDEENGYEEDELHVGDEEESYIGHEWDDYSGWDDYSEWEDFRDYDSWNLSDYETDDFSENDNSRSSKGREVAGDPWAEYAGPNIGWEFLADTRWSEGSKSAGWNRIRTEQEGDSMGEQEHDHSAWKPPLEMHYDVDYPERWREGRSGSRSARNDSKKGTKKRGKWGAKSGKRKAKQKRAVKNMW